MDSSEVGKYGSLCLMKRLEPDKVVAAYPIDEEEVSFGRDPSCSIRLYYDSVSAVHCKIVFHERKAFLVVLGTNGLFVDGCPVFPSTASTAGPVTVPLPNNSTIEIHKKRFQFCYPPKELRAALLATPSRDAESTPERHRRKRALRMSMIQSAQVFTPRPSTNAQENLRILKTPIKNPFQLPSRRESSPLKRGAYVAEEDVADDDEKEEEEEDEDIVLVETNHPSVVEEDRDLVILERVVVRDPPPQPTPQPQRQVQFPFVAPSPRQVAPPQTPRRRPPRPSLHRAVLIRSAQRTALRMEMEREEEREVEEVEETIQPQGLPMEDVHEEDEGGQDAGDEDGGDVDVDEDEDAGDVGPLSSLKKSLTAVRNSWPFRSSSVPQDEEGPEPAEHEEQDITEAHDFDEDDEAEDHGDDEPMEEDHEHTDSAEQQEEEAHAESAHSTFAIPPRIPNRPPPLGSFMTPQVSRHRDYSVITASGSGRRSHVRYSVGGFTPGGIQGVHAGIQPQALVMSSKTEGAPSGPRRVRLMEPWRVGDIVVPVANDEDDEEEFKEEEGIKEERETPEAPPLPSTPSRGRREKLSEAERQAIIERRRSALRTPDAFFGGQAPGSRRLSLFPLSPAKPSTQSHPPPIPALPFGASSASASTSASGSTTAPSEDVKPELADTSEELAEDTSVLLARMKQMVEGAKRRQSMGPRPSAGLAASPQKPGGFSLLAPDAHRAFDPVKSVFVPAGEDEPQTEMEKETGGGASDKENGDVSMAESEHRPHEDADAEMEAETSTRGRAQTAPRPQPQETPRLEGLRHVFAVPREAATPSFTGIREMYARPAQPATPRLDGVRGLFQPERVVQTPAFEGVGEMLATPAGFRPPAVEVAAEQGEVGAGTSAGNEAEPLAEEEAQLEEYEEHDARDAHDENNVGNESDEHDEHDEHESLEHDTRSAGSTRGRKAASTSRTPSARSLRSTPRTAPAHREEELPTVDEEEAQGPHPGASRVTRKPRLRSASADPEPVEPGPSKPTRRTRKATASPPATDEAHPTTKRRTRRTPTPEVHTTAPPTRRAGKARAASAADDDDPLDSIARARSPEIPLPEPAAAAAVRRSARGKLTMAIKEEDEEEGASTPAAEPAPTPALAPAPRAARGRRHAGATGIPRSTGRGGRAAASTSTRKPPASAAAKENTPERQLAASPADGEQAGAAAKASAPRTAARGKATRNAGRVRASEEPEQPDAASKVRASRVKARK